MYNLPMTDFKYITKKNGKLEKYYQAYCNLCNKNRGFVRKSRIDNICQECGGKKVGLKNLGKIGPNKGKKFSKEACTNMSNAKKELAQQGWIPWNKGKSEEREEVRAKIAAAKKGSIAPNKGVPMTHEQKIKLSCINRGIEIEEFDDFTMSENHHERGKFSDLQLQKQCFERDNYTCIICSIRGSTLHAHHLNGWKDFPEERFELANLATLCKMCHDSFHSKFGIGKLVPNTKEQFELFKTSQVKINTNLNNGPSILPTKKLLHILTGAPASGKSWTLSQLSNFDCLDSDIIPKKELRQRALEVQKPLLTLTIGVSTFIKNNPDFDIKLIVIVEGIETLNQRMLAREGKITPTIERRAKRMTALAKQAIFSGTSEEVLNFLKNI